MHKMILGALAMAVCLLLSAPATMAAEMSDVTLPDTMNVENTDLVLNGLGLREKFFIDIYVGALYLPAKSSDAQTILATDQVRHMIMAFVYDVDKESINDAWYECLEDNTPEHGPELKTKFDQLASFMTDIEEGGQFVFSYIPAKGTSVEIWQGEMGSAERTGQVKGIIQGKDFSDALLKCWIGPEPGPGESFKEEILGLD